jgi:DNA polymerase III sliding clamp (beta) subunit (PCNA family)
MGKMNRKDLVEKLGMVSQALAKDNLIPIFKCFAFTEENVMACNDTLAITSPCVTDMAFCVHGETLKGLLENSHSETVEFSIKDDDLIVKAGKSTFKLPWFPVEDFLWLVPNDEVKAKFNLDADFITGLEACLQTAGTDTARAALMGVQFTNGTMYSTDGDALTRFVTNAKVKHAFMLPSSFCNALIKITKESEATKGLVAISEEWAKVELDSKYTVYGRLMVNDNPIDHEGLIKKSIKTKPQFIKFPGGLHQALSRARVVADAESAKTVFTVEAGRLKLLTTTSMGVINDVLPFTGHSDVQANVSAERIQQCISLCDEMSVAENCCTFRLGSTLFILSGNLGG